MSGDSRATNTTTGPSLKSLLTRDGAPWRPYEDAGILVKAAKAPRPASTIFQQSERLMLSHLKAGCLWPEGGRNETWRVGDYSYYILQFAPAPGMAVYVQFWSEPEEGGTLFQVSSGVWNKPTDEYLDAEKQERLRDHGFERGGSGSNFRKSIAVKDDTEARAAAREAVAILCGVLGYDGTSDLRFKLSLQTHAQVRHVFSNLSPGTLQKMLHEWGFSSEINGETGEAPILQSRTDHGPFFVSFANPTETALSRYQTLLIHTFRGGQGQGLGEIANRLNRQLLSVKAVVDDDGDLRLQSLVNMVGGVSAEHLRAEFELWRYVLGAVDKEFLDEQ